MRILVVVGLVVACSSKPAPPPVTPIGSEIPIDAAVDAVPTVVETPQSVDIDSTEILARDVTTDRALVKHVLFAWKDLAEAYHGSLDPRAAQRTRAEAAKLALAIAKQATPANFDALVKEHSEDPGSLTGEPYTVLPDTGFVMEFKQLALRLNINEVGIVKTMFGYHVMLRVEPPPPDPLESSAIMVRPQGVGPVIVRHILIGWDGKQSTDANAKSRTKGEADKLAKLLFDQVRSGKDMLLLMKQYSEDPGSKDGKPYTVESTSPMAEPFKQLALRLNENEVGMVITAFGWHVIKRFPPPPLDPLESAAILKRTTVAAKVKVKHILVGKEKQKTAAAQTKVVKDTLAKLAKGADFDGLMHAISEDPGGGDGYEVLPDSPMVEPFKKLALRLNVGELGVVKSEFGFHIIKRLE